jgi:hypothetical protein
LSHNRFKVPFRVQLFESSIKPFCLFEMVKLKNDQPT